MNLFGWNAEVKALGARQLRVDYAIPSDKFAASNLYLPKDKSLAMKGPIAIAARGQCSEGEMDLDLGPSGGLYRVIAIPTYTPAEERGPNGESGVVALIEPRGQRQAKVKIIVPGPRLF